MAREAVLATGCKSNLKQMGLAFFSYASDYSDHYPVYTDPNTGIREASGAPVALNSYCGKTLDHKKARNYFNPRCGPGHDGSKIFYCPSRHNLTGAARYSDYGARHSLWNPPGWDNLKFTRLKKPASSVLRVDTGSETVSYGSVDFNYIHQVHFRHRKKTNALYFDGHVGTINQIFVNADFMKVMEIE